MYPKSMTPYWALVSLCILALPLASADGGERPSASMFPLIGWWGPPATEEDYRIYRDAHFNAVLIPANPPLAGPIGLARFMGLQVLLLRPQEVWADPAAWRRYADNFDNVMGWVLGEHVAPDAISSMADYVKQVRRVDNSRLPLLTLSPPVSGPRSGAAVKQLLEAGLPALCYHRFSLYEDGSSDEDAFYEDLEFARRIVIQTGVPLWGMILVTKHGPYRRASESDVRFQVYSYLAAGARGLCYYTYSSPPPGGPRTVDNATWGKPMVDPATRRTLYGWEIVEQVNREVLGLAHALGRLTSTGMYFVGNEPKGRAPLPFGKTLITSLSAERALVGFFRDPEGRTWAMLVNRRYGKQKSAMGQSSTMQIFTDRRVRRVVEVDRLTANDKEIPIKDGSFLITIPGGTGSLVRFETHQAVEAVSPRETELFPATGASEDAS